jgi:bacterioferritin-associated ferredoxin
VYICVCARVTESALREHVARGARTLVDVARACKAGTGCRLCVPALKKFLDEAHEAQAEAQATLTQKSEEEPDTPK